MVILTQYIIFHFQNLPFLFPCKKNIYFLEFSGKYWKHVSLLLLFVIHDSNLLNILKILLKISIYIFFFRFPHTIIRSMFYWTVVTCLRVSLFTSLHPCLQDWSQLSLPHQSMLLKPESWIRQGNVSDTTGIFQEFRSTSFQLTSVFLLRQMTPFIWVECVLIV